MIPDYLPFLIKGTGVTPRDGGCVVQIANWLHDDKLWTDQPICVDRVLAHWSIMINDLLDDDHRRQLALLAPRLSGTASNEAGIRGVHLELLDWMSNNPIPVTTKVDRKESWTANGMVIEYGTTMLIAPGDQQKAIEWLEALINQYYRSVNATPAPLLTEVQARSLASVMGQ